MRNLQTDNSVVTARRKREQEVGGGGEAVEEMGASVLVSTIKENKLRKNTRKMALGQSC